MKTFTAYYVSWSPRIGEATYTRSFDTAEERDKFATWIDAKSVQTWESECSY